MSSLIEAYNYDIFISYRQKDNLPSLSSGRQASNDGWVTEARSYWTDLTKESLNKALEFLNSAVEKNSDWAPLYAGVAEVYVGMSQMGYLSPDEAMIKINKNLDKAIELDPDFPGSHYTKAIFAVWTEWDWEKGEREFLKALEINPNDMMSRIFYAHLLMILRRDDEALFNSQMAAELDPMNPLVLGLSAMVDYADSIQRSLEKSKRALEIDPGNRLALAAFGYSSYLMVDYKTSIETEFKIHSELDEKARHSILAEFHKRGYKAALETMLTYLEEYSITNYISYTEMGGYYYTLGNLDKTIEYYLKAYEMHDPMLPYFTSPCYGFDQIKDDPRIISLIKKMNLPLPESD